MKIDAKISILFAEDGLRIEIVDSTSGMMFFRGKMNAEETCAALSRLARVSVSDAQVFGLDVVGKKLETRTITTPISRSYKYRKDLVLSVATSACPAGWFVHDGFNSQDSFFSKGNEDFVRFTVRRWVDQEEQPVFDRISAAMKAESRLNALRDAVAWEHEVREAHDWLIGFQHLRRWSGLNECMAAASAEVDRLIVSEGADNCQGAG